MKNKIIFNILILLMISIVVSIGSYFSYINLFVLNNRELNITNRIEKLDIKKRSIEVNIDETENQLKELDEKEKMLLISQEELKLRESELDEELLTLEKLEKEIEEKEKELGI